VGAGKSASLPIRVISTIRYACNEADIVP
jgi:hypothetical protein